VNADIRIIVHRSDASCLLCYVAHHDDARVLRLPYRFLADRAVSVAPGGAARSGNRKLSDVLNGSDPDVARAVDQAVRRGNPQRHTERFWFRTPFGRRNLLWMSSNPFGRWDFISWELIGIIHPSNTTQIAGSAHFFGDMPRRRKVVEAFAAGLMPDFTRGFAARPYLRMQRKFVAPDSVTVGALITIVGRILPLLVGEATPPALSVE
jgi:hypothetical protein